MFPKSFSVIYSPIFFANRIARVAIIAVISGAITTRKCELPHSLVSQYKLSTQPSNSFSRPRQDGQ